MNPTHGHVWDKPTPGNTPGDTNTELDVGRVDP